MEIACLDLGSNTFHLQHFRVSEGSAMDCVLDVKHSVRLGDSVYSSGGIDAATLRTAHAAIADLVARSAARRPERSVAVATAALRMASNGQALLDRVHTELGTRVELLSPEDEAELSYLGATCSAEVGGRRVCVIDLGGGSAELAVGEGTRCLLVDSMPLGSLRLRQSRSGVLTRAEAGYLREQIRFAHGRRLAIAARLKPERVVFASGTARTARWLAMRGTQDGGRTGQLGLEHLYNSVGQHVERPAEELVALGVEEGRADTVMLSQLVMIAMMEGLGTSRAHVIDGGLRQGLALREYRRARGFESARPASLRHAVGER